MSSLNTSVILMLRSISTPASQMIKLKPGEYLVGRDPSCDIVILDPYISRTHAKIFYRDGRWYLEDLGSRNGTYIDGEDIRGRGAVELREGMEVVLGFSTIIVKNFEQSL